MSDTPLECFHSAVNRFDSFIHALPQATGAKRLQEIMQELLPKLWTEDLRPGWSSTLSTLDWISSVNLSCMEKALQCLDTKVTVMPEFSFDFASDITMEKVH
ncbi:hypothetical protein K443DRAFT_11747 [Laccaria amethystina LaAM-08-1]|uniref:Uncharacterized protein n=1 Tax=Laccaria amethystina LaAM-08-1 TaxID=1095629 RepID=A0A0C9XFK6_9AGAR|nr:hypothetical protein K443DRAFT_11747 [Laccaria amethystina LaAM-08-1]